MAVATKQLPVNLNGAQVSNDADDLIAFDRPYVAEVAIVGVTPLIMHRYSPESVGEKSRAGKGTLAKKTDDIESYVYRVSDTDRRVGLEGLALRAAIVEAGRYRQDPRSSRKSMIDLLRAVVMPLTVVATFEPNTEAWDYLDSRRVVVMRSAVTRVRPAMREGWRATFQLQVTMPNLVPASVLQSLIVDAGRLCGLLDFRPTYGRFNVDRFEILELDSALAAD